MRGNLFHHGANIGQMRRKRAEILLQILLVPKIDEGLSKEGNTLSACAGIWSPDWAINTSKPTVLRPPFCHLYLAP